MGAIARHLQSYLDFATVDGTVNNGGTWVLVAGPVLLALLGLYIVWNLAAATANGVARLLRPAARAAVPATVAAPAPGVVDTAPLAPVTPMAGYARPRPVSSPRRAEALARSAA